MDKNVGLYDSRGNCLARENLLIAFFGNRPFAGMAKGAAYCVEKYLKMVPANALQWSIIGRTAGTHKPLTQKDVARCLSLLTPAIAKQKDVHFRLMGPAKYGPDYGVVVNGYKSPAKRGFLDQTNAIEMAFPREFLQTKSADAFAAIVKDMFEAFSGDSGYAAPSLCVGRENAIDEAAAYMAPLAMKHHGYDVASTLYTATGLGTLSRGARWLTLLSTDLIKTLGGQASLRKELADGVDVIEGAHGVMLRAGATPEMGDTNRKETTPLVASVAHAIERVTLFGDDALLPIFDDEPERRDRWERRFWWQSSPGRP